jgi:CRISPR system Cascade subunit CasE
MTPENLYLSRLTLKRSTEIAPLINVLQPALRRGRGDGDGRIEIDHRLLWTAMPDEVQAGHDKGEAAFLWRRDDRAGRYYILGPAPRTQSTFFEVETRPFEARLSQGDRLAFLLRVNATVDRRRGGRSSRERADVAMDLLRPFGPGERAERRTELAAGAAAEWLGARAETSGFSLDALHLDGYRAVAITRNPNKTGRIGVFDLRGLLTVARPDLFLARIASGFGRAKAFGCGLMLVRRAG